MKKILTFAFAACAMYASAAINPEEFIDLEFDKEYTVEQFKTFKGKITPAESGVIIEYGGIPAFTLAANGELEQIPDWEYAGYINGKQAYQFKAVAGTTYYIYSDFVMDDGVISLSLNPALRILDIDPAPGSVFDISANEFATVTTNQNISVGKASISVASTSVDAEMIIYGTATSVRMRQALSELYNNGVITGGENITVVLSNIKDALGKRIDDITLKYVAASAPYTLVDTQIPDPVYSWVPAGSEGAKAVFTFSGPVAPNPVVNLCYSPIELGYEYTEPLNAVVDGNTITVDLAGKLRTPEIMSGSGSVLDFIDIVLIGIKDNRGQYMLANEGSLGSYLFRVPFTNIEPITFAVEFTPAYGSNLKDETEISIAYNHPDQLDFSAVIFTSGNESAAISKSDLTVDNGLITVRIPEGWQNKSNVVVTLADLETADGIDHSAEFTAKYNGFALLFSNPANGASLAALNKGRTITIDSNLNDGEQVSLTISCNDETIYGPVEMVQRSEGQYIHAMTEDVTFYSGESYLFTFSARGTQETIQISGTTTPFEFSDIELRSISPSEGATLIGNDSITVEFTGLVAIEKAAGSVDFTAEGLSTDLDVTGYDNMWKLILPADLPEGTFEIAFSAVDQNDNIVKGNVGSEAQSHFVVSYITTSGILEITASGEKQQIFDLNGRRLSATTKKGIFIINGKKTLVR